MNYLKLFGKTFAVIVLSLFAIRGLIKLYLLLPATARWWMLGILISAGLAAFLAFLIYILEDDF